MAPRPHRPVKCRPSSVAIALFTTLLTVNFAIFLLLLPLPSPTLDSSPIKHVQVELWSKAAIGQFLWRDVLHGETHPVNGIPEDLYLEGNVTYGGVNIRFRSGPSLKTASLQAFPVRNLVLVLNWRTKELVNSSLEWLETAFTRKPETRNIAIVALGNEQCHNRWFEEWLERNDSESKFRFLYIVYDWKRIDERRFFQWPLGTAVYRSFQGPEKGDRDALIHHDRPFLCNFIATVYVNTSRGELSNMFAVQSNLRSLCLVRTRPEWTPEEADSSARFYRHALRASDLTLSPIGQNHECYRIYEAAAYGSTPVVEINLGHVRHSSCDRSRALRLLEKFQAPFIYVRNWTLELPIIIERQRSKTLEERQAMRRNVLQWYDEFRLKLRKEFIDHIQNKFL